jgi:peptidyl-prolyl cis-trans isomerase A (cyclophilin A)
MIRKTLLTLGVLAVAVGALPQAQATEALMDPSALTEEAPETFLAKFETSKGDFVVEVTRAWAPLGADRFYNLVKNGFFDDARFFRVLDGFVAQFGINGDPKVSAVWREATIEDDPVTGSNKRGTLVFATSGKDSRTTQLFINFKDNTRLDGMGFAPFGRVLEGMDVVGGFYKGYGEGAPQGKGPAQHRIQAEGNEYLKKDFPDLDYVKKATVVPASE